MNKTSILELADQNQWYLIDAKGKTLGRLATYIAHILRGKNLRSYTPSLESSQCIVVINASRIMISGQKQAQKQYMRHSGYPGGLTIETFAQLQSRLPQKIIEKAVKNMLPKTKLGRKMYRNLKVYPGINHPHNAQNPIVIQL